MDCRSLARRVLGLALVVHGCAADGDADSADGSTAGTIGDSSGAVPSTSSSSEPSDTGGTTSTGDVGTTLPDASSTTTDTAADESTGTPPPVDPCAAERSPACPEQASAPEHGGLVEIDRCGFPLDDISIDPTNDALIDALAQQLPVVGFDTIVADLNRDVTSVASVAGGPDGLAYGFVWDDEENDKAWWIPQGISGSADASEECLVGQFSGRALLACGRIFVAPDSLAGLAGRSVRARGQRVAKAYGAAGQACDTDHNALTKLFEVDRIACTHGPKLPRIDTAFTCR